MKRFIRWLVRLADSERGQDMVEYALITVMVSIPIVLAAMALPSAIEVWAEQVAAAIPGAAG